MRWKKNLYIILNENSREKKEITFGINLTFSKLIILESIQNELNLKFDYLNLNNLML